MTFWKRLWPRNSSEADNPEIDEERQAFLRVIAQEGAWILTTEDVKLVDYHDDEGQHVWPFFTTQELAAAWVRKSRVTEVTVFGCLQLKPEAIVGNIERLLARGTRVLFDGRSDPERVLTATDAAFLRRLVGGKEA